MAPLALRTLLALGLAGPCGAAPASPGGREVIKVPGWPMPKGFPLSFGIKANGMAYVSGLMGFDMVTLKRAPGGVGPETRQALENLRRILAAAGSSMERVATCSVSLANVTRDFMEMNKAYSSFWPQGSPDAAAPPTRVTVEVAALASNVAVEIQCAAALNSTPRTAVGRATVMPFVPAVVAGDMVYLSGMQGIDMATHKRVPGGIKAETRQTLANIKATLLRAASSPSLVVGCEVTIQDLKDFAAMNEVYRAFWPKDSPMGGLPSRVCVQAELAGGAAVEMRCVAASAASAASRGCAPEAVSVPGWETPAGLPLSMAVKAGGMVYVSGLQGWNMSAPAMPLVPGGAGAETTQLLENVRAALEAAGSKMERVVGCDVSLRDMGDFAAMNKAYAQFWPADPPSRVAVQVAGLAGTAKVEIKCLAVLDTDTDVGAERDHSSELIV